MKRNIIARAMGSKACGGGLVALAMLSALGGCASTSGTSASPATVTRFSAPADSAAWGEGTVFIDTAPGTTASALEAAPYKAAVARELAALGYQEAPRGAADKIVAVGIDQTLRAPQARRGPVNVGVGGSTGSYGSGLGVGVGINLGDLINGPPQERVDTRLSVMIRDKASGQSIWEGRADITESAAEAGSDLGAARLARALFQGFPGESGETIRVGVD